MACSRRQFIGSLGGASLSLILGCASRRGPSCGVAAAVNDFEWSPMEKTLLGGGGESFSIVTLRDPERKVLRTRARNVPPNMDLEKVAFRMEATMKKAGGVGIAGPQVGLNVRVATLKLDYKEERSQTIFVCNPSIVERSSETQEGYEGCLSIPGMGGIVRRNSWIKIGYSDIQGKRIETEARGYNAVLWQHELDHLDGRLYVDNLLGTLLPMEEVRRLRQQMEEMKTNPSAWNRQRTGASQNPIVAML